MRPGSKARKLAPGLVLILLATALLASTGVTACAPPCGPIQVVVDIQVEPSRGITFGDKDSLELEGKISFYVDIDQNGFWFDPLSPPVITIAPHNQPPWIETTVDPTTYEVPILDPTHIGPEPGGSATDLRYYWEAPLHVTLKKLRDPTPEELDRSSGLLRKDGTYRVGVTASSTGSLLAPTLLGNGMGFQEGNDFKEFRIVPEIAGVKWLPTGPDGALVPENGVVPGTLANPGASTPFASAAWTFLGTAFLAVLTRRRWH